MSENTINTQKIQQATAQINQLIKISTESLTCGPDCQKMKTSSDLKQKYMDAQNNILTAPYKLDEAKKNYITFTQGDATYNEEHEQDLKNTFNKIKINMTATFDEAITNAYSLTDIYDSLYTNYQNVFELYKKYLNENKNLQKLVKNTKNDTITNDRKSFYEMQEYETLSQWYSIFRWIYIFLIIIFIIAMLLFRNNINYSFKSKIFILILFIIYPFVITHLLNYVVQFMQYIYSLMPKNIYTKL